MKIMMSEEAKKGVDSYHPVPTAFPYGGLQARPEARSVADARRGQ